MRELIEKRFDKFLNDLETIVNIDSGSGYAPGLEAVSNFFRDRFAGIGWKTAGHAFDGGKVPCLEVANKSRTGSDSAFDLLFIGHMDTVFGPGVGRRPAVYAGRKTGLRSGRLRYERGPGDHAACC